MPSLRGAVNQAMAICWDEGYGYRLGGTARSHADGVDCSGLINRVLHDNGFSYPASHVGTKNMKSKLKAAGFKIKVVSSKAQLASLIQAGDIVVMNHYPVGEGGHTFIYMEDVEAYTDYRGYSANKDIVHKVKVEAASSRGETAQGDHRRGGTGAYWEVWVHAYYDLTNDYDPSDPNDEVYIAHWPGGLDGGGFGILTLKKLMDQNFGRTDNATTRLP